MAQIKSTQEKMLGALLTMDVYSVFELLLRLELEWFDKGLNRNILEAIFELNKQNKPSDILTVTQILRDKKMLEKHSVLKISSLISGTDFRAGIIPVLISQLDYEYKRSNVLLFLNDTTRRINEETFSIDQFIIDLDEIKQISTGSIEVHETNEEIIEEILYNHDKAKSGVATGVKTGLSQLDGHIEMEPVDLMIIGARTAMGKTVFGVTYVCKKAFQHNEHVSFFALEMSLIQMTRRIVAHMTGIDSKRIRKGLCTNAELAEIKACKNHEGWKYIHQYAGSQSIKGITRQVTIDKHKYGITSFVVDYLQKMIALRGKSEFEKTTANSNDLTELVKNIKVPCVAFSQLKRPTVPNEQVKPPTMSDLRGSGDIEQDASIIGFLHRPEYYGQGQKGVGEFYLAKNREDETNKVFKFGVDNRISKWGEYTPPKKDSTDDDDLPF